ncbi:MAG: hypothetical protein G01um101419_93 [Parcubacteria group bacterium Gr01-1014_19]|nr:MAG: hypothetical protein G01um101419_93 [Parcubacteria group bacterium Gr01-1014_19]
MSHSYDSIKRCPVCKEDTPHDFRNLFGDVCKVCGVIRLADCDGAFQKCARCGEFISAKPSMVLDLEKEAMIITPPPPHICKDLTQEKGVSNG